MIPPVPPRPDGYAIYNPWTGMWSRGGQGPKWGKTPKIWSNISHLKNHINQHVYCSYNRGAYIIPAYYTMCQIVDLSTNQELTAFTIRSYMEDYAKRQIAERYSCKHYRIIEE